MQTSVVSEKQKSQRMPSVPSSIRKSVDTEVAIPEHVYHQAPVQAQPAPKIDFDKIVVDVLANTYQSALIEVSNDEILKQEKMKEEMALELKAIQDQIEESQRQFELKKLQ